MTNDIIYFIYIPVNISFPELKMKERRRFNDVLVPVISSVYYIHLMIQGLLWKSDNPDDDDGDFEPEYSDPTITWWLIPMELPDNDFDPK